MSIRIAREYFAKDMVNVQSTDWLPETYETEAAAEEAARALAATKKSSRTLYTVMVRSTLSGGSAHWTAARSF